MKRTVTLLLLVFLTQLLSAQPKSAGLDISYFGLSAGYSHYVRDHKSFHSTEFRIDFDGLFHGKVLLPGVSAAYHYDFFHSYGLRNGGDLGIYAGPGVRAGWVKDGKNDFGALFGLSVEAGIEYSAPFAPLSIGARISPTMGFHVHRTSPESRHCEMSAYKNGYTFGFAPELTIRYEFGRRGAYNAPAEEWLRNSACETRKAKVRFTFGTESVYNIYFVHYFKSNYFDEDGIRHYRNGIGRGVSHDMSVLLHCGMNIGRHFNASLASGFTTVGMKSRPAIPVIARISVYYGNGDADRGCLFNYAEAGPAFTLSGNFYRTPCLFGLGAGYRVAIDRRNRLELKMAVSGSHSSPYLRSSIDAVMSHEVALGLSFALGFVF